VGIAWPSICRRGAPFERNDPNLWSTGLHRNSRKGGERREPPTLAGRNLEKFKGSPSRSV